MLISNAELKEKLGTKQDSQVIRWLTENGIRWMRDAKKRPITTTDEIQRRLRKDSGDEVDFA